MVGVFWYMTWLADLYVIVDELAEAVVQVGMHQFSDMIGEQFCHYVRGDNGVCFTGEDRAFVANSNGIWYMGENPMVQTPDSVDWCVLPLFHSIFANMRIIFQDLGR